MKHDEVSGAMPKHPLLFIVKLCTISSAAILIVYHFNQFRLDRQRNGESGKLAVVQNVPRNAPHEYARESPFERSDKRRKALQEYCKTRPNLQRISTAFPEHLHVIESQRLMYCRIPKVATTGWKRMLGLYLGQTEAEMKSWTKDEIHARLVIPNLVNDYQNSSMWKDLFSKYFSFVFVREPFERLLSAYRNKFMSPKDVSLLEKFGPRIFQMFRQPGINIKEAYETGKIITFEEFLRFVVYQHQNEPLYVDEHWTTYHHDCSPCAIPYTFIGKYETLKEDADAILMITGSKQEFLIDIKDYVVDAAQLMKKFYSDVPRDLLAQIYKIFKNDCNAYGYEVPSFLVHKIEESSSVGASEFDENVPVLENVSVM